MVASVQPHLDAALATLIDEFDDDIAEIVAEMTPCGHCATQKYETYVMLTVLRRAFVRSLRDDAA